MRARSAFVRDVGAAIQTTFDPLEEGVLGKDRRIGQRRDGKAETAKAGDGDGGEQRLLDKASVFQIVEAPGHEIASGIDREVKHRQAR